MFLEMKNEKEKFMIKFQSYRNILEENFWCFDKELEKLDDIVQYIYKGVVIMFYLYLVFFVEQKKELFDIVFWIVVLGKGILVVDEFVGSMVKWLS